MNARFAESCPQSPLDLSDPERRIQFLSETDGRTTRDRCLKCEQDIFIGVFFDGTNNNKFRDTPNFSQSNVARLYEVYPGTPAKQDRPALKPMVVPGGTAERPIFPDQRFLPKNFSDQEFPYYRKIYVPGLGTPAPDVGDGGDGFDRIRGLAAAYGGSRRLVWASMQLINQVHAAIFKVALAPEIELPPGSRREFGPAQLDEALHAYQHRLRADLDRRGNALPTLRKIRLSVFGFSRGAAAARAWVNIVVNRWGSSFFGIPLQIDFLGLFDSVASVGATAALPRPPGAKPFEGHGAWGGPEFMRIPDSVRRTVHLVAAHEVRGSFPLDSVSRHEQLPLNCKEIVYPGVHSDVGGGYPPWDQGRARGVGAKGDALKISQVPLSQMYREARMAGVPLVPETSMSDRQKESFAISDRLRHDFNAYVNATRRGTVPSTDGTGEEQFAQMFPSEVQPREELFRILRRHYVLMLTWRKVMLKTPGTIAKLPYEKGVSGESWYQDAEDLREAEQELDKELAFLADKQVNKFESIDDPIEGASMQWVALASLTSVGVGSMAEAARRWVMGTPFPELMREKQRQWDHWLREEWAKAGADTLPPAATTLFTDYVHDSRAWFKASVARDGRFAPDDDEWFLYGKRTRTLESRRAALVQRAMASASPSDPDRLRAEAELRELTNPGQPLIQGGREPYRMWGYLRHRAIFYAGTVGDQNWNRKLQQIDAEEQKRLLARSLDQRIEDEKARFAKDMKQRQDQMSSTLRSRQQQGLPVDDYAAAAKGAMARATEAHERVLRELNAKREMAII